MDEGKNPAKVRAAKARAEALTTEERKEIGRKAAAARWDKAKEVPHAIYGSPDRLLPIGNVELQCYVLGDEEKTRVITQAGFLEALGRHRKANVRDEGGEEPTPAILQGKALKPFISNELLEKSRPIKFRLPSGTMASGYRAEILPLVCEAYLKARDADDLPHNQQHVARQAEILIRALAHTGIIALVDEVTGFQRDRAANALTEILEKFIAKELRPWVRTFPDEFYEQIFRLRGLTFPKDSVQRPQYFGHLTNDIIYSRLAPGVLQELKKATPRDDQGRHKQHLFRRLSADLGHPRLREHLAAVITTMKLSDSYDDFLQKLERVRPRFLALKSPMITPKQLNLPGL
ncbi:MAG: P63C domain-containing protein [Stellaceae bacterium]